jgi:N-sulfoglucosamine sulfohydrolase
MDRPPNILLLIGEDTGRHLGCYGDPCGRTPHLDALAREGARFENAFAHCPVCAPSRGSLVSGRYPWSLGIHSMRSALTKAPEMFTHVLVRAGYAVHWPTKLDFNFEPEGDWCTHQDDWWTCGLPADRPFFAYRNVACTHESGMWTDSGTRPNWQEPVSAAQTDPASVPVPPYLPDLPEVRQQIARYYDNLAQQDHCWKECLDALDATGQAEHTIVIYLSDHGRGLPREKRWCYEAGLHLPLIIRWPERLNAGTVIPDLVSWVDIAPTLLDWIGLPIPAEFQGGALRIEEGRPVSSRAFHFGGRDRMDEAYDCQRMVRSKDGLYVRNYFPEIPTARRNRYQEQSPAVKAMREAWAAGKLRSPADIWFRGDRAPEEFFRVSEDPDCLFNCAGAENAQADMSEHREALRAHLETVGDLGATPESTLVERGIVKDLIAEYTERLGDLPSHLAVEKSPPASIEMPRARPD